MGRSRRKLTSVFRGESGKHYRVLKGADRGAPEFECTVYRKFYLKGEVCLKYIQNN
jgi:hypothetical protein